MNRCRVISDHYAMSALFPHLPSMYHYCCFSNVPIHIALSTHYNAYSYVAEVVMWKSIRFGTHALEIEQLPQHISIASVIQCESIWS